MWGIGLVTVTELFRSECYYSSVVEGRISYDLSALAVFASGIELMTGAVCKSSMIVSVAITVRLGGVVPRGKFLIFRRAMGQLFEGLL